MKGPKKEWCKHIQAVTTVIWAFDQTLNEWIWVLQYGKNPKQDGWVDFSHRRFKSCPICGKHRPKIRR